MSVTTTSASAPDVAAPRPPQRHLAKRGWLGRLVWRALIFVLYVFLLAPVLVVVVMSFDTQSFMSFPPQGFTLDWYARLTENAAFIRGFQVSLIVGVCTCALATLIGVPAALALARHRFRGSGAVSSLFLAPLMVPTVVLGLALLLTLSPWGLTGSYPGLVLAHLAITTPYVVRTTAMSLLTADLSCEEAARILGANSWATFRRITLPLALPGVLAGAVIAFIISFDEAVISLFVVGPAATTLPVEIYNYVQYRSDPQIAALSVVLIAISVVVVVIIERIIGLSRALR
jgi:putative spermidine/putrescine transport system permease protein